MKRILLEGLVVAIVGALLALIANGVSPRGIQLTRNYFPATPSGGGIALAPVPGTSGSSNTHVPTAAEQALMRLREEGLGVVDLNQVTQLFNDPRRDQDLVVFVDARKDEHYQEGHIPGAYQFDYYYPAKYAGVVLPLCQNAQQVVVYCTGGDCEDSRLTAVMLSQAGVDKAKLFVYAGGITEWKAKSMPLEIGARKSGVIQNTNAAKAPDQAGFTSR